MSWGRRRFTIEELRLVCKIKGYRGTTSKKRQFFQDYLTQLNVPDEEIRTLARQALTGQFGAGTTKEVVVERIVERGIKLEPDVLAAIRAEVSKAHPHKIILTSAADTKPTALKERVHPVFERALRAARAGLNVLLVGPAGCGKTTLAEQLARSLRYTYGTLHCTAGASEAQLLGWLLPVGSSGTFKYVPAEFVRLWEQGNAVFLLDELDGSDPNMLLVINGALSNGQLHVPQRFQEPHVKRGKNMIVIAAANTYGTGADMIYAGRNQLDAATLDRFYVIQMDYDVEMEREIAGTEIMLFEWVMALRKKILDHRLRRIASTRMLLKAVTAVKAGIKVEIVKRDLMAGWTKDELMKVGEAA